MESLKTTKKKLGSGRYQLHLLKSAKGNIKSNMEKTVKATEKFHTNLYRDQSAQDRGSEREAADLEVASVATDEAIDTLKGIRMDKAEIEE